MSPNIIIPMLKELLSSNRLLNTAACYLLSLMTPADKHTQANAELLTGKDNTLFSNFLAAHSSISGVALSRATRRALKKLTRKRTLIEKGTPWTVAILIDATLHERSSRHVDNSQRFNHGQGWVIGHQWTNIGILIGGQFIPLPPLPFHSLKYCKKNGLDYKTEHEKVSNYLRTFSLSQVGIDIPPEELVVLMDSGYDCKDIQNTVISRGWDFIASLRYTRKISPVPRTWIGIEQYFGDGRRPWKSVRMASYRGIKRRIRQYRYKQQVGFLKGVRRQVQLVCSQRSHEANKKYLSCSNINVNPKAIILCYRLRWKIEIFHREIKSYLGMEDAGVRSFKAQTNHVHWVYVAYILLKERYPLFGVRHGQIQLIKEIQEKEIRNSIKTLTQINGGRTLKSQYQSVLRGSNMKKVA